MMIHKMRYHESLGEAKTSQLQHQHFTNIQGDLIDGISTACQRFQPLLSYVFLAYYDADWKL